MSDLRPQVLADLVSGAALSLLESVYLPLFLPDVTFKMVGYGMPRVNGSRLLSKSLLDSKSVGWKPGLRIIDRQQQCPD